MGRDDQFAGTRIRNTGFEEETRAFLQLRLRLLLAILCFFFAAFTVYIIAWEVGLGGQTLLASVVSILTELPGPLLTGNLALTAALYFLLRIRSLSYWALTTLDTVLLQCVLGLAVVPYAQYEAPTMDVALVAIAISIMTRSILIPSTASMTFMLSMPAVLVILLIDVNRYHGVQAIVIHIILLTWAVSVAALASHVNVGLRRQTFHARRLGQYELEGRIGEGTMGVVHRATHALLKRPTAIKFLRPEIASVQTSNRFEEEVQQTCRLTHPNTISIYDYGHTPEGVFYYAMELLDGEDLKQVVERAGPMPPERVIHVLVQACGALAEAHDKGLVHRDVKAANIMLCDQGGDCDVVKVLDFGLVKDLDSPGLGQSLEGQLIGTPECMAPEVTTGASVGPPADVYSLCAVGYYLATGARLFDTSDTAEFLRSHREEPPVPLSRRVPSFPEDLEAVLLSGLAKDPAARPDARALRDQLHSCESAGLWDAARARSWWTEARASGGGNRST